MTTRNSIANPFKWNYNEDNIEARFKYYDSLYNQSDKLDNIDNLENITNITCTLTTLDDTLVNLLGLDFNDLAILEFSSIKYIDIIINGHTRYLSLPELLTTYSKKRKADPNIFRILFFIDMFLIYYIKKSTINTDKQKIFKIYGYFLYRLGENKDRIPTIRSTDIHIMDLNLKKLNDFRFSYTDARKFAKEYEEKITKTIIKQQEKAKNILNKKLEAAAKKAAEAQAAAEEAAAKAEEEEAAKAEKEEAAAAAAAAKAAKAAEAEAKEAAKAAKAAKAAEAEAEKAAAAAATAEAAAKEAANEAANARAAAAANAKAKAANELIDIRNKEIERLNKIIQEDVEINKEIEAEIKFTNLIKSDREYTDDIDYDDDLPINININKSEYASYTNITEIENIDKLSELLENMKIEEEIIFHEMNNEKKWEVLKDEFKFHRIKNETCIQYKEQINKIKNNQEIDMYNLYDYIIYYLTDKLFYNDDKELPEYIRIQKEEFLSMLKSTVERDFGSHISYYKERYTESLSPIFISINFKFNFNLDDFDSDFPKYVTNLLTYIITLENIEQIKDIIDLMTAIYDEVYNKYKKYFPGKSINELVMDYNIIKIISYDLLIQAFGTNYNYLDKLIKFLENRNIYKIEKKGIIKLNKQNKKRKRSHGIQCGGAKIKVLGRTRNIILKKKREYVMIKGELVLLSKAIAFENKLKAKEKKSKKPQTPVQSVQRSSSKKQ